MPEAVGPSTRRLRQPRVTVVTPVYNGAEHLEECLDSVLDQGYPNLEYIVVDGGSTDGTLEILRRYEHLLAFWSSERDAGQADALNKGFARATGELVCWLNADDFFLPGALVAAAAIYRSDPQAPFYFGNGYRVDRAGRRVREFFVDGQIHFRSEALVFGLNFILQPATFIRRQALESVGLIDATLHYGFDTDLWIRLSQLGSPRPIHRHLAGSREYETTKTSTGSFTRAEELRRIAERYANVPATPGSICYYLDTLHRLATARPDIFPPPYVRDVESFWAATAELLRRFGVRPDGLPVSDWSPLDVASSPRPKDGKIRVGVEMRHITRGVSGGIVPHLVGILAKLFERRTDLDFVVFSTVFNHGLLAREFPNVEVLTLSIDHYFDELGHLVHEYDVDVLFRSYPTVEQVEFPYERQIFFLPDLQHEDFPDFFDQRTLHARTLAFRVALERAGAIMTGSEHTRQVIVERAGADRDVFVASPALPPEFVEATSASVSLEERAALPDGDFFFFPANLWPHKNHKHLFEAFRRFRRRTGTDVELVLTGDTSGWEELRRDFDDLPIRHLGYVRPALLKLCYEQALALVFFSFYEGFGIPLLEAFSVGTPVACSSTTSLPEVADGAALMCDPADVDAIASVLERLAIDAELRARLVARGRERAAAYGWDRSAASLGQAIERVVERAQARPTDYLPLVSIVTPSFNQGRFIARTIDSVLAQTYPNVEHLVVDGGSTDGTVDVLRSYGDSVRWISEPDSGQSEAINKGLRAVQGEIVGYLNSDDVLLPHAIERVVDHFRSQPLCDLVYGDADYIDEHDHVTGSYLTAEYSFDRLVWDCCICQPAAFWRAAAGEAVGPFDEELEYVMDYDYWLRFARGGFLIQYLPQKLAQSRLHADAKTLRAREAIYREVFEVSRRRVAYLSRSYVDGYWHHLVYERPDHVARMLRGFPGIRKTLVSAHHRWLNRHRYLSGWWIAAELRSLARSPARAARRRARTLKTSARALRSPWSRAGRVPNEAETLRPRVTGFRVDNWVEPQLDVVVDTRLRGRELRLVGEPVAPMTVAVSTGDQQLGQFDLAKNGRQTVLVELPPGPRAVLTYVFSRHEPDAHGRSVSFRLQETNLFTEQDLGRIG